MAQVPFQVLAFDGGGIRGAFGIGVIAELEQRLGRPITDYFDLIAGTSTGAITSAGLAVGKSGAELVQFYEQFLKVPSCDLFLPFSNTVYSRGTFC